VTTVNASGGRCACRCMQGRRAFVSVFVSNVRNFNTLTTQATRIDRKNYGTIKTPEPNHTASVAQTCTYSGNWKHDRKGQRKKDHATATPQELLNEDDNPHRSWHHSSRRATATSSREKHGRFPHQGARIRTSIQCAIELYRC
jgi:hypothetical protein